MTITTDCAWCGGHGLVTGFGGDPTDCGECQGAGVVWPPRCDRCGAFGRVGAPCKRCAQLRKDDET